MPMASWQLLAALASAPGLLFLPMALAPAAHALPGTGGENHHLAQHRTEIKSHMRELMDDADEEEEYFSHFGDRTHKKVMQRRIAMSDRTGDWRAAELAAGAPAREDGLVAAAYEGDGDVEDLVASADPDNLGGLRAASSASSAPREQPRKKFSSLREAIAALR
mmetsp:Transcript_133378/g.414768  ORF Transcript_133378/g.414768 Transcript_133378/m.414768 type:complete len:164 (+) Transcript_133378:94-585(+)